MVVLTILDGINFEVRKQCNCNNCYRNDSGGSNSPPPRPSRPPLQPLNKSINSAFESYEKPPSPCDRSAPQSPRLHPGIRPPGSPIDGGPPSPRDRGSPRELNPPSPQFPRVPPPSPNFSRERFGSSGSQGSIQERGKGNQHKSLNILHQRPGLKVCISEMVQV